MTRPNRQAATLLWVPASGRRVRGLRLRRWPAATWLALVLVTVAIAGALGARQAGLLGFGEVKSLTEENELLRKRLARLAADAEELRSWLVESESLEERMRLTAGLEPIDEHVRLMGVGGPDFTAEDPLYTLDSGLAEEVAASERELDALLRQADLQRYSYLEILENLEQTREQLARVPSISPVAEGRITSAYGRRSDPFTERRAFHHGVDIAARRGAPIVATADGKVVIAGKNADYGLTVKIDHGNGVESLYAHILDLKVKKGDRVKRGQEIARVGSTGRATAPHVHYEVRVDRRARNPKHYMLDLDVVLN